MFKIAILIVFGIFAYFIAKSYKGYSKDYQANKQKEYELIIALIARVAKMDGSINELEAEVIKNTINSMANDFKDPNKMKDIFTNIFHKDKNYTLDIESISKSLFKQLRANYLKRLKIVEFLLHLAFIDKNFQYQEEDIIKKISKYLNIDRQDYIRLLNLFKTYYKTDEKNIFYNTSANNLQKAYEMLGVDQNTPLDEIKKKYKLLVRKYHPDIMQGRGFKKDIIEKSTRKLQQINSAYDIIKKYK